MTTRLRDLIKLVRQCKTAAEERAIVTRETALLRTQFKDTKDEYRHRNVAKLLYIQMLGYPTAFGQMACLTLIASPYYSDKRIGYLALMLLLDEKQELLMMATNAMHNDLNHPNQYIVGLALCALANIASDEIARATVQDVEKLLSSSNPYIRKKAALCAIRIIRKVPETAERFVPKVRSLLSDRNHGVLVTALQLMIELCNVNAEHIAYFRRHVPSLVRLLRALVSAGYAAEYDVGGITDPFLQVRLLHLLRILGQANAEASEQMSDLLAQVATNTEGIRNVGNAILYECIQTIMTIDAGKDLRVLAITLLGKFLLNKDNNIRYVALNSLCKVVQTDVDSVQRHRNTIVDCLKDSDISIRKRALELIYGLVNTSNVRVLVQELLGYLLVADKELREDITAKICLVTERFAPSKKWQVDTTLKVMSLSGQYIPEEVKSNLIAVIASDESLHSYAAQKFYVTLIKDLTKEVVSFVGAWCLGEFGDLLITPHPGDDDQLVVSEEELLSLMATILRHPSTTQQVRAVSVTALLKFVRSFKKPASMVSIRDLIMQYQTHLSVELQQRACEYVNFLHLPNFMELRDSILERMPAMEEKSKYTEASAATASEARGELTTMKREHPAHTTEITATPITTPTAPAASPAPAPAPVPSLLESLLVPGASPTPTVAPGSPAPPRSGNLLESLMGSPAPPPVTSTGPSIAPLLAAGSALMGVLPTSDDKPAFSAPILGYDKNGLQVVFSLTAAPGDAILATASLSNSGDRPMSGVSLLTAVPTYLKLQMAPPSGTSLPPNNGGKITQQIRLVNTDPSKPMRIRIKVEFTAGEEKFSDIGEVTFPPV